MQYDLEKISRCFALEGNFVFAQSYGEGHINDTYLITTSKEKYIIQRVNNSVFKNPVQVIENIVAVTSYLAEIIKENGGDPKRETLTLIPATDGKMYHKEPDGSIFRAYLFIADAICYQLIEDKKQFYSSGKAFGKFQSMLKDFPAQKLYETIPDFHNTVNRYEIFKDTLKADKAGRAKTAENEIKFALAHEKDAYPIIEAINNKEIPLRVTHNDTKLNNIMFDTNSGDALCVIDLDTVMPGSMLYDFGDSIRFGASTALEDEKDLFKVSMDLSLFEEYTKGFLEGVEGRITPKEAELLAFSAKLLTLECGVRFLTDYLDGDNYFKTAYPEHNLDRAKNQFKLVWDMDNKMDKMNEIVKKYYR